MVADHWAEGKTVTGSPHNRLTAWLGAWKYVLILAVLLAGSLWLNVHQWKQAITAPLRDQVAGLEQAQETAAGLIADGQARERGLLEAAGAVESRLRSAGKAYRAAAAAQPLPILCAPGPDRMDATNRALGAPNEE